MDTYFLINYFRLIKEFDRELKDEEGRNPPEVNKQLNDEKQSMVSIWNLLCFAQCLMNMHMHNRDTILYVRSVIHDMKWWVAYFFGPICVCAYETLLYVQYFLFADQRAEFICGIEKNVSWIFIFLFEVMSWDLFCLV